LRRLVFTVEPGPDATGSEKDLVLRQNPILMTMDGDEQHYPLVLARNVKDFIVECWNTNAMEWDDEWVDTNSIPPMVRVSLLLGSSTDSGSAATLAITRLIVMPSITMPAVVQMPRGGGNIPNNNPNNNNPNNNNLNNQINNQNGQKHNFPKN
jgi:hypothetical protein